MFRKTTEEDYYELQLIARNRLHPSGLPVFFLGVLFFEASMFGATLFGMKMSEYVTDPIWPKINAMNWWIIAVQLIPTLGFINKRIRYRHQTLQAVFLVVAASVFSISAYVFFFLICEDSRSPDWVSRMGGIALATGGALLIYSVIRGFWRVRRGEFRKGGKLLYDFQNKKSAVAVPLLCAFTVLALCFGRYANAEGDIEALSPLGMLVICILLQYTIALVLPEFILLAYCKMRFKSFRIAAPPGLFTETELQRMNEPGQMNGWSMPIRTLKFWAGWNMQGKKASFGSLFAVWTEAAGIVLLLLLLLFVSYEDGRATLLDDFGGFLLASAVISYGVSLALLLPLQFVLWMVKLFFKK